MFWGRVSGMQGMDGTLPPERRDSKHGTASRRTIGWCSGTRNMEAAEASAEVLIEGACGIVTLNNAKHRNALSGFLIGQLCEALDDLRTRRVRVVVLRAPAGSKIFSSGRHPRTADQWPRSPHLQ